MRWWVNVIKVLGEKINLKMLGILYEQSTKTHKKIGSTPQIKKQIVKQKCFNQRFILCEFIQLVCKSWKFTLALIKLSNQDLFKKCWKSIHWMLVHNRNYFNCIIIKAFNCFRFVLSNLLSLLYTKEISKFYNTFFELSFECIYTVC